MSWPLANLADVAFFQEGPGVRKWQFRAEGIKLINVKNIVNEQLKIENSDKYLDPSEVEEKYSHFLCDSGDLVMASSGATWGKTAWVSEKDLPLCMNTSMIRFKSIDDKTLDIKYLRYYLKTANFRKDMERLVTGSAQPNFGSSHLKQIRVPLPPLTEQKRIAAILDKADAIRRKRQQAIQLADDFLRAVFLDMFGDPVTNPKGLLKSSIGDLCEVVTGATPSRKVDDYYGGDVPWVKTTEVDGYIINKTEECITNEGLNNSNCKLNPVGSIVLAMYGQGKTRGKVGMLGIEAATNQACAVIKPSSAVMMEYLYIYLKMSYESLRSLGQGAGQPNLNLSIVKAFPVLLPSENEQREFVLISERIKDLKVKSNLGSQESSSFFSSLSKKAFSGQF